MGALKSSRQHQWTAPPAGQSPLHVCSVCGNRKTTPYDQEECFGFDHVEIKTLDDYDPIA
jgi:hypothetical protein